MRVENVTDSEKIAFPNLVRVKQMGNITELMRSQRRNYKITIRKLDKNHYVDLRTGEIKECNHIENRAGNIEYVRQTLNKLRDKLNANILDTKKCRWVTLTYAENMTDTKKLKCDSNKFHRQMRNKFGHYEYMDIAEPQGRGAWHLHIVMIFPDTAPYINNDATKKGWKITDFWTHGFCVVKRLDDVDNVGAYLTAYLGDMELSDASQYDLQYAGAVKEIEVENEKGQKLSKKYIKGARLHLYPANFKIYRASKGIKDATVDYMSLKDAKKIVSADTLTYKKTIKLYDTKSEYENHIDYEYYNSKRAICQQLDAKEV